MYLIMKRETIFSVIVAVAMAPAVAAQAPELTPLPEGIILTSSVRVEEIPGPGAEAQVDSSGERAASAAPGCPNPACTCGSDCACTPGNVCGTASPTPAPSAPSVTVVQPPVASPPVPTVAPTPSPAPVPTIAPAPAPERSGCGKATRPGVKVKRVRKVVRLMPGDMPPCGKARPFGAPVDGTVPPCVRRHGRVMSSAPAFSVPEACRPIVYPAHPSAPAASPQAVKVIINGVETVIPLIDGGVNITIKPL